MATKKKRSRKVRKSRNPRKKSVTIKRTVVRRTIIRKIGKAPKVSKITRAKRIIIGEADKALKDALYQRDKAKTYKQHRAAQNRVDAARRLLRKFE